MAYYVAIDGGGTKTDIVAFCENGSTIDRVRTGPSNPNSVGMEMCVQTLIDGIRALEMNGETPTALFGGIAGSMSGTNREQIESALKNAFPKCECWIDSDIQCVFGAADVDGDCMALICGTGCVLYLRKDDRITRFGGWGYLLDQAGSGFDIGRDVIRACLAEEEGLIPKAGGIMIDLAREKLGAHAWDAVGELYKAGKDCIAGYARCAFEAAEAGDRLALSILERNAKHPAELILRAAQSCKTRKAIVSGSVALGNKLYLEMIQNSLRERYEFIPLNKPAVYGAAVQCLKRMHIEFSRTDFEMKFLKQYK